MANEERIGKVIEVLCAVCKVKTKHTVKGSCKTHFTDDENDISAGGTHDLLTCNGCGHVTYREDFWFSEEPGERRVTLYPPRGDQAFARVPREFHHLPWGGPLESVYRQTVSAFANQLMTLAGAGVRLLIEGVCKDRGVVDGEVIDKNGLRKRRDSLEGKINGLVEHGFIGRKQADTLHEIRFLGNDAAHELDQPSQKVVAVAIDIVEHILDQVYDQPEKAKALAARKRPPK
jgi:hypothetical protein